MRFGLFIPCILVVSLAAAEGPGSASIASERFADDRKPSLNGRTPAVSPNTLYSAEMETTACRDRTHAVRQGRGLYSLDREDGANEPYLIKAIDQRIDGCSVMVMHHDINDVRPLPDVQPHSARLIPLR